MNEALQNVSAVVHTSKGDIKLRLFAGKAPVTVVQSGFPLVVSGVWIRTVFD